MMLNRYFGITAGLLIILLIYSPHIDQWLAILFFNPNSRYFYGETSLYCKFIYSSITWITTILILLPILMLVFSKKIQWFGSSRITRKLALIMLLSMTLGPGLLVNVAFKNNWGRPRPYQVIRDGATFMPVWQHNFNGSKDNSFPSGHASIGFFLGVPLLALGYRRRGLLVSCIGGSLVGIVRIAQGGHYFSDIVFAGIFVWLSAELAVYIINSLDQKGILGE